MNAEQASKRAMWEPTRRINGEGRRHWGTGGRTPAKRYEPVVPPGYLATACLYTEIGRNTGDPGQRVRDPTGSRQGTGRAVGGVGEVHSTDEAG